MIDGSACTRGAWATGFDVFLVIGLIEGLHISQPSQNAVHEFV